MIDLIAFDADDTLWHNENLYQEGLERFHKILAGYPLTGPVEARQQEIEIANLEYYGYGVSGFVLSLIEAAIELTGGRIQATDIHKLVELAKEMFSAEVVLVDGVHATLAALNGNATLMLITKGDLRHQQYKLLRSGLEGSFRFVEIVSDKSPETYARILSARGVPPERFLMVGDSLRSDIYPVLELGGRAVHIPNSSAWAHEATVPLQTTEPGFPPDRFRQIRSLKDLPEAIRDWMDRE